jgi:uncharacterized protein with FMN-binding domain
MKKACQHALILLFLTVLGSSCSGDHKGAIRRGPVDRERLIDGVYEGSSRAGPNKAPVKVTIEDERIVTIEIVKHRAWKGRKAESAIPKRIIEAQSTEVDAVTGATNSSRVIINAVQKAIEKAYRK